MATSQELFIGRTCASGLFYRTVQDELRTEDYIVISTKQSKANGTHLQLLVRSLSVQFFLVDECENER